MNEIERKPLDEQLVAAVIAGDNNKIEKLVKDGANVNRQLDESDFRGSILNIAIDKDNLEVVKTLLRHKANPNGFPGIPLVPLSMCVMGKSKNCLEIAKELIANGAKINGIAHNDFIPLHYARSLDSVKFLIKNGADVNSKNKDGDISLHNAVGERRDFVEFLIENNANVNSKNKNGETPLHKAAQRGDLDLVKLLIENGADVSATDKNGNTPLDKVHIGTKLDLVDILLKHGGKANHQDFYTQLLKEAVLKENLYLIKCSLQNGADINVVVIHASTPLFYCLYYQENMDAVKLIVDHIAKLEAAGLYVSPKNLELKNKLKDPLCQQYNSDIASSYEESFKKYMEELKKLGRENKPLYDFLQESNINKLASIWEKNEDLRNEFNDPASLKKQCQVYAGILINKANDVKEEIFLHNHAPLILALNTHYGCDLQEMTFAEREFFFQAHRDDFKEELGGGGITLISFIEIKDVEARHAPTLKVQAFAEMVKNNLVNKKLDDLETKQHKAREAGSGIH